MNKKNIILVALALVLAGVYVVYFTDWFKPKIIQISHTSRPGRARNGGTPVVQLNFGLGDYYELTEIKVVPLAALETNKLAQPVWHLVSDSGSDSLDHFVYGQKIEGMDPAVEGSRPQKLQPGVTYRLFIAAGKIKGQHDFEIKPR
jgi:hypothetical protein